MTQPDSTKIVSNNIRDLLEARKWSNRDLARRSRVSDRMIGKILNEESAPTTETVDKIASAFGVPGWQLLTPNCVKTFARKTNLLDVHEAYIHADDDGRRVMEAAADYITKHKS